MGHRWKLPILLHIRAPRQNVVSCVRPYVGPTGPELKNPSSSPSSPPVNRNKSSVDSFKHCVDLVRQYDSSNYLSGLLMPAAVRPHVFALLAFNVELAMVRDHIKRNAGIAGITRLQFWRDAISSVCGRTRGPIPRQPVALALKAFGTQEDFEPLYELVEARLQTLGDRPFESVAALESYAEKTSGTLLLLVMNALARNGQEVITKEMQAAASSMGKSIGVMNFLRSTVPLLSRGIVLLPTDLMTIHGLSADGVYSNKAPDAIRNLSVDLAKVSDMWLRESRQFAPHISRNVSLAFASSGANVDHSLKILKKAKYSLFDARLQRGPDMLALKLLWRKYRGVY